MKFRLDIGSMNFRNLLNPILYFTIFVFTTFFVLNLPQYDFISSQSKNDVINSVSIIVLPLIFLVFCFETIFFPKNNGSKGEYGSSVAYMPHKFNPIEPADLEVAAVHEIGHVMLFFAVGTPLERLYVQINDHNIGTSNNGYVHYRYENKGEISLSAKEIQILMLMVLAGIQAERFYFKEPKMFGGSSDLDKWLHYAKAFLLHEENVIFYQSPENRYEHGHNQELLSDLKSKQINILNEFFNINRDVLQDMVHELLEKKRLDHPELKKHFEKIKNISEIEML